MTDKLYTPPRSLVPFLTSEQFISLVTGPVGSGKSSAAMVKIIYHASRMRAGRDGVRHSRCVVVRNTAQMLTDSTIKTFFEWFPEDEAGTYLRTPKNFVLRMDDIECEVMFRGLDDANDVRRLLSVETSFAVMDEFREIHKDIFEALKARVGRYPSEASGGCYTDDGTPNGRLWGASNAPTEGTFWAQTLTVPPKNLAWFRQPSALSPEADWTKNLPRGYYDTLAEGASQDFVRVYVHNEFGLTPTAGRPVFERVFNRLTHTTEHAPNRINAPLVIGIDAGLHPAAVLTQQTYDGRVIVHESLLGPDDGIGAQRFVSTLLKPLLFNQYPNMEVLVVIDPAAFQRAQTDERCVADVLRAEGLRVIPARTNAIAARLAAVEKYLTRMVNGHTGLLIAPAALDLITALSGGYHYPTNTRGFTADTPAKTHPASDLADALQYACLYHDGGVLFQGAQMGRARETEASQVAWV